QIFRNASNAAHIIKILPIANAIEGKSKYISSAIKTENIKPNAAANLLGAAKIGFGVKFKVLEITFALSANNEGILVKTRTAKSATINSARIFQLVNNNNIVKRTT